MDQAEFRQNRLLLGFCSKKPPRLLSGQKGREGAGMLFRRRFLGWGRDKGGAPGSLHSALFSFLQIAVKERACFWAGGAAVLSLQCNWQRMLLPGTPPCWCVQTQSINCAACSSSFLSREFPTWTLRMGLDHYALRSFHSLDNENRLDPRKAFLEDCATMS